MHAAERACSLNLKKVCLAGGILQGPKVIGGDYWCEAAKYSKSGWKWGVRHTVM